MSIFIFNSTIIKSRFIETIQISDFSAYKFQQYQQIFQMVKNHANDLKNRFLRFVNHVTKDTETWKNNDRRTMNVWLTENYFFVNDVLKKIRTIVFKTKMILTIIRRNMKDQTYQYIQNRSLNVIKHEISLTEKRKFNWCFRQIIDIMNEKLTERPIEVPVKKKIFNIAWKKLARKIIDEINDRFIKFGRININVSKIQIVKNSFVDLSADFFVRIQSFSISTSSFHEQTHSKKYTISFFFVIFSNLRFFSFQVIFRLLRNFFSWIFVSRHLKFHQKCRFQDNFESRLFQLRNSKFQNNFKFRSPRSRPENLEKILNKQFSPSIFRFLNFSISTASVQYFPWDLTRNENRMW